MGRFTEDEIRGKLRELKPLGPHKMKKIDASCYRIYFREQITDEELCKMPKFFNVDYAIRYKHSPLHVIDLVRVG